MRGGTGQPVCSTATRLRRAWRVVGVAVALVSFLGPSRLAFGQAVLPPALQAALIVRVLLHDTKIDRTRMDDYAIVLLDSPQSHARLPALRAAFATAALASRSVLASELVVDSSTVALYFSADTAVDVVGAFARRHKVLTMADDVRVAEAGAASVAIGVGADGRQEIVINITRLQTEGHTLAPELLARARVVK